MTESKRYEEMGRVAEEYKVTEKTLGCLRHKLRELKTQFRSASLCLEAGGLEAYRKDGLVILSSEIRGEVNYPSSDERAQLLLSIQNTEVELSNLERRKKLLGIG